MHISATLEDVPPLIFASLGGFLQQVFGARRLLQVSAFYGRTNNWIKIWSFIIYMSLKVSALPTVLTWIVITANPNSVACLLASRWAMTISWQSIRLCLKQIIINMHVTQIHPLTQQSPYKKIAALHRLLGGLANSLLTGNVYMVECAPGNLVPSLKQLEVKTC